jgi:phage baseplate assembly protein W
MFSKMRIYDEREDYGFIGIKLPTNGLQTKTVGGFFNMSRTTEDQAVTNYINLLLTRKGERYMQINFGVGLQDYLFEQNTESIRTEIEFEIERQSAYWLPYIKNHSIVVKGRPTSDVSVNGDPENAIQIIITFSVENSNANKTITIFQEGGAISTIVQ